MAHKTENRPLADETAPLLETIEHIERLKSRPANWNGNDVAAPNPKSIEQAQQLLSEVFSAIHQIKETEWISPFVASNEEGDVALEWAHGEKSLCLYVSANAQWYLKSWGTNILNEMEDGDIHSASDFLPVWRWLLGE
jgi:hypothetical protein